MTSDKLLGGQTLLTTLLYGLVSLLLFNSFGLVFTCAMLLIVLFKLAIYRSLVQGPSEKLVNLLALTVILVVFVAIGFSNLVEMFVSLLLGACALKTIQAKTKKQAMSVQLLNFFVYPCFFIFSQNVLSLLFVLVLLVVNLAQMLWIEHGIALRSAMRQASRHLLLALPLAAIMVVLLPKVSPFWQLPGANKTQTGLSEDIDPFEISELSRSDELVFRAILPDNAQIKPPFYWRTLVHDNYDGTRWRVSAHHDLPLQAPYRAVGESYTVIARASGKTWLYSLGQAKSSTRGVNTNQFGTLFMQKRLSSSMEYQVTPIQTTGPGLVNWQYQLNTALPDSINPLATALATQWDAKTNNTAEFIQQVKLYFVQNSFHYSLKPPVISDRNSIDRFLTETREGFCGHYAASAAFMLRAAGIPARLVSGYLGGEYNAERGYYSVYQYDAHAWVEYYVPQQGWYRLDPTAWVAPDRLSGSLSELTALEDEFKDNLGLSLMSYSNLALVNWVRLQIEQLDYQWTRWVLNFDQQKQSRLLRDLFGHYHKLLPGLSVFLLLIAIFVARFWYLQRKQVVRLPEAVRLHHAICRLAEGELHKITPAQALQVLQSQYPNLSQELAEFNQYFVKSRFSQAQLTKSEATRMKALGRLIIKKAKK
ncbi:transglutaminaseTgpA domain-containing protein [Pseudoalteromonas rubra]|uniref:transglutaminaseTgpA domain-containing protein n=1 Tax=Pseudoalteromonas rubra TaxID=43658 RepID=UPI000F79F9DB|nr:transglutaminaseTgpA domain-containing protein [Pseudoalteromonas rubra]